MFWNKKKKKIVHMPPGNFYISVVTGSKISKDPADRQPFVRQDSIINFLLHNTSKNCLD